MAVLVLAFLLAASAADGQEKLQGRYVFVNNTTFPETVLLPLIEMNLNRYEKEGFAESFLDDAAYVLVRYYRSRGFPGAVAEFEKKMPAEGRTVIFTIHEGVRVKIERVAFAGNFRFSARELLEAADVRYLVEGEYFVRREVERDLEMIRRHYHRQGFPDAGAEPEILQAPSGESVQILVRIEEGVRVFLGRIRFTGNDSLTTEALQDVVRRFLQPLRPYYLMVAEDVRAAVLDHYAGQGYPFTRIDVSDAVDRKTGSAEVRLTIDEKPRARFGTVTLAGNDLTLDSVVRGSLLFEEGEWFSQDRVWKSQVELYNTGLFSRVTMEPGAYYPDQKDPTRGVLDYEIRMEEREPWQVEFYGGYGSYEQARGGVAVRHINIFGTGRLLEGKVQASIKNLRGEVNFTDPRLLGKGITFSLRNSFEKREHPSFDLKRFEYVLEVGFPLTREIEAKVGYRYTASDATDIKDPNDVDLKGNIGISGLNAGFVYDSRNNPADPTSGLFLGATYEWASRGLGSELNFQRITGNVKGFLSPAEGWVVAVGARGGILAPYAGTRTMPIQERFFNGGESSVRSFKKFDLGPRSGSDPIGGQAFLVLNTELRFPIYKVFGGAVFGDAGNVRRAYRDFGLGALQYAVGAGLHVKTPVGPVRLDFGLNPDPEGDEDDWNVHLSVGYSF